MSKVHIFNLCVTKTPFRTLLLVFFFCRQFVRTSATTSVGQKCLEKNCPTSRLNGRPCRGKLHDTILDWEHNLPEKDLGLADFHSW